jgi:hypothetical protein
MLQRRRKLQRHNVAAPSLLQQCKRQHCYPCNFRSFVEPPSVHPSNVRFSSDCPTSSACVTVDVIALHPACVTANVIALRPACVTVDVIGLCPACVTADVLPSYRPMSYHFTSCLFIQHLFDFRAIFVCHDLFPTTHFILQIVHCVRIL